MDKNPCVFKAGEGSNMGDRVFYYHKSEADSFVRVYEFEEDEKSIAIVHETKIIPVTAEMFELRYGTLYLTNENSQFGGLLDPLKV